MNILIVSVLSGLVGVVSGTLADDTDSVLTVEFREGGKVAFKCEVNVVDTDINKMALRKGGEKPTYDEATAIDATDADPKVQKETCASKTCMTKTYSFENYKNLLNGGSFTCSLQKPPANQNGAISSSFSKAVVLPVSSARRIVDSLAVTFVCLVASVMMKYKY